MPSFSFASDQVRLISNADQALQVRIDIIQQAKREILVEYFSIWNDEQSLASLSFLIEAAQKGIKVKILMDAIASTVPRSLMNALLMKGRDSSGNQNLEIKLYNPISINLFEGTHRDHAKMIVVDGRITLSGGRNLGDKYFGKNPDRNFSDLDVLVQGDISKTVQKNFYDVWNSSISKNPLLFENAEEKLRLGSCSPSEETFELCESARKRALLEHKKELKRISEFMNSFSMANTLPNRTLKKNTKTDWFSGIHEKNTVSFLSHEPGALVDNTNNHMTSDLLMALLQAEKEIKIISPYLIPTDELFSAFESLIVAV